MKRYFNFCINTLKKILDSRYTKLSYSQFGEDLILDAYFNKNTGFYVDVGAFHPKRITNMGLFYNRGWKGINIEPVKKNFDSFLKFRKKDINLNCAVGLKNESKNIFIPVEKSCASFDLDFLKDFGKYKAEDVKVCRLDWILDNYLPNKKVIDFFDIDCEGFDLNVLKSNNWVKYRPKIILVEVDKVDIDSFLVSVGYKLLFRTNANAIYEKVVE